MWTHAQTVGYMMFLGCACDFMCPTGSSRHHVCSASGVTWRHLWAWSSSSFDKRKFCSKHINDWCNSSQLLPFTAAKHFYYMYMYMYVHVRLYFHVYNLNFKAVGMSLICWVNSCCCSRVSVTSFLRHHASLLRGFRRMCTLLVWILTVHRATAAGSDRQSLPLLQRALLDKSR